MKGSIKVGAVIGFLMPILWGMASFMLFNLPEGPAADRYWRLNHIFCPFFSFPTIIELPLTAGVYALLALLITITIRGLRSSKASA
jgi:hypothetical protein